MLQTISWTGQAVQLLDQTRLPTETVYVRITDEKQMWDAIRRLVVRGAPAIGVAAAFGVFLGVRDCRENLGRRVGEVCDFLATSRPTAVNLFWALDRMRRIAGSMPPDENPAAFQQRLLDECLAMLQEDTQACRAIGRHGLDLLASISARPIGILTHCNAGGLATVQYGTALAPIYLGHERGLPLHVWIDETRPLLQGSRITAFELKSNGIPATVLCDNMAASVMSQGKIQAVIVGADRIASNGDVANKIGTLGVAILAEHYHLPFYVAAPISSIDFSIASGDQIPIEQRDPREVSHNLGRQTAPDGMEIFNPAFDITPAALVTAIITEHGVVRPPYAKSLAAWAHP